jgi:putative selenium metabolism hydrolase
MTEKLPVSREIIQQIRARVAAQGDTIVRFMREICAIPSMNSRIGPVGERIAAEMRRLGFDEVRFDRMGNLLGRIGSGPKVLLYDSHVDTVGVGDRSTWQWDPFEGKVEDGLLYARGACDEKGSTPGMVYGLALARDLGLLDGTTAYYFGNMAEDCTGQSCQVLVEVEKIKPDWVVVGEPTEMNVFRGHKGRVELKVVAQGRSAHAASNELGDNAIYKLLPIVSGVRELNHQLHIDPFLGQGRITATSIQSRSPSLNAVPDECTLTIDRRLTFGETKEAALAEVEALILHDDRQAVTVQITHHDTPSYTGFVYPVEKYFPAWTLAENHALVQSGLLTSEAMWGGRAKAGKWNFSTNGTYWAGKAGIPTIGFGPGDEELAHTHNEHIQLDDVVRATEWYACFPALLPGTASPIK